MSKPNHQTTPRAISLAYWGRLLPILALTLPLVGSACITSGVIGDDCPTAPDCAVGGSAGSSSGNPADTTCGGLLGTTCAKGLYCEYAISSSCGATDQTGVCKAMPDACDEVYSPVCGCDGMTYGNECSAHGAGVSVASDGECPGGAGGTGAGGTGAGGTGTGGTGAGGTGTGGGPSCGGLLGAGCPADQYCNFPAAAQCGAADQTGFCASKPQACDAIYAPVCGCDDVTYSSDCAAAAAGKAVAKTGACTPTGSTCGGRGGGTCATTEYCKYEPAAMCGRADATGTCTELPQGAGCTAVYDPVCGCDGKTYGNACEAQVAGASVDHTGACASGGTCGGLRGSQCASGTFCDFPDMACGNADGTGTCVIIPQICNDIAAPVCGCDGKPYANACSANAKGISVANQGACK